MYKIEDLKREGLWLSQLDAQGIHSKVNQISCGHIADGIVFSGEEKQPAISASDDDQSDIGKKLRLALEVSDGILKAKQELDAKNTELQAEIAIYHEGNTARNQLLSAIKDYFAAIEHPSEVEVDLLDQVSKALEAQESIPEIKVQNDGKVTFQLPIKGEHHATKKKRLKEAGIVEHTVTQEDLDNNADLAAAGVNVGDVIEIPVEE